VGKHQGAEKKEVKSSHYYLFLHQDLFPAVAELLMACWYLWVRSEG
jgi:hypothetical protein